MKMSKGVVMAAPGTHARAAEQVDERGLSAAAVAAVAGSKMAGFDVTDADLGVLRAYERGEFTVEEYVARVKAANAAR